MPRSLRHERDHPSEDERPQPAGYRQGAGASEGRAGGVREREAVVEVEGDRRGGAGGDLGQLGLADRERGVFGRAGREQQGAGADHKREAGGGGDGARPVRPAPPHLAGPAAPPLHDLLLSSLPIAGRTEADVVVARVGPVPAPGGRPAAP